MTVSCFKVSWYLNVNEMYSITWPPNPTIFAICPLQKKSVQCYPRKWQSNKIEMTRVLIWPRETQISPNRHQRLGRHLWERNRLLSYPGNSLGPFATSRILFILMAQESWVFIKSCYLSLSFSLKFDKFFWIHGFFVW